MKELVLTPREIEKRWRAAARRAADFRAAAESAPTKKIKAMLVRRGRFQISVNDLVKLLEHQRGNCCFFGNKLTRDGLLKAALILDDPKDGWVKGNVAWGSHRYALMKGKVSHKMMLALARRVMTRANRPIPRFREARTSRELGT